MTEQEKRAEFCRKTGRVATANLVEYQAFLWGMEFGATADREACAKACDESAQRLRMNGCGHEAAAVEDVADTLRSNV